MNLLVGFIAGALLGSATAGLCVRWARRRAPDQGQERVASGASPAAVAASGDDRYMLLAETLPDLVVELDAELRIAWANETASRQLGTSSAGGLAFPHTAAPGEAAEAREWLLALLSHSGPETANFCISHTRSDGRVRQVLWTCRRSRQPGGLLCVGKDVTRRRAAEEALRDQLKRDHLILETAQDGFWLLDGEGTILECNRTAAELLGLSVRELLLRNVAELVPAGAPGLPEWLAQVSTRRGRRLLAQLVRPGSSESIEVELSLARSPDPGQELFVFVRDVTTQRRVDREKTLLTAAIEQASDAIRVFDAAGGLRYANAASLRLTGRSRAELEAEGLGALLPLPRPEDMTSWSGVVCGRRPDGTTYEAETATTLIRGGLSEEARFLVAVQRDITGLRQAQRLEALGTLIAGVAHEINNPVGFLTLHTQFLADYCEDTLRQLDGQLDPQARVARLPWEVCKREVPRVLSGMLGGLERLSAIVATLRGFAAPDDPPQVTDVVRLVKAAAVAVRHDFRRDGVAMALELDLAVPRVQVVPHRIEQVLVNLLTNARLAVTRPGGRVELGVRPCAFGVELWVADDGPGVAEEIKSRIFDPFFTTRRGAGGMGLGLSLSHQILREINGRIRYEDDDSGGARFVLEIPEVQHPEQTEALALSGNALDA